MTKFLDDTLGLDKVAMARALRLALTAWLAFAIAAELHVQNAYWAAITVWVVAQPTRGMLLERGLFRLIGTLAGAALGFGILLIPVSPYLHLAAVGLCVAASCALTNILRGPPSYGATLTGMTSAVVVLPSVLEPAQSFALALARVECTLIGVVVVTIVVALFTPRPDRQAFFATVRRLSADAVSFAALCAGPPRAGTEQLAHEILGDVSTLEASAVAATAASTDGRRRLHYIDHAMEAVLAVMSAGQAIAFARARGATLPDDLDDRLAALSVQLRHEAPGSIDWAQATAGLTGFDPALERLLEALRQLIHLQAGIHDDSGATDRSLFVKAILLTPHRDWMVASRTGLIAGLATFLCAALGYAAGLPEGELMALGVCIYSMVLSSMPRPEKAAPLMLYGVFGGVCFATLYRFAVQPHIVSDTALILSILPFALLGGFARASRKTAVPALDANLCFMLASQAGHAAVSGTEILAASGALVLAVGLVAAGVVGLPRRADRHVTKLARSIDLDLGRLLTPHPGRTVVWRRHGARQILRLLLRLGRVGTLGGDVSAGLLAAVNLGHAIAALQASAAASACAAEALRALAGFSTAPEAAASRLDVLAAQPQAAASAGAMREAAASLRVGAPLFLMANA